MNMPMITGADIEFGNSIIGDGIGHSGVTSWDASARLLAEAPGKRSGPNGLSVHPSTVSGGWSWNQGGGGQSGASWNACEMDEEEDCSSPPYAAQMFRDYGRSWYVYSLYCDMGHIEGCLPETISCFDHVAALHGLYNIVADMRTQAIKKLPRGRDLFVTINNTDGHEHTSYGAHFNVMISRKLFHALLHRKPHLLGFAASALAALTVLFGQGHILCRPGHKARYSLSQRAHHIGLLVAPHTTVSYRRPLLNSRDESHAHEAIARLHLINFDASLQQYAALFRVWFVQSLLAAMEEGYYDSRLILEDPVAALKTWSIGFSPLTGGIIPACPRVEGVPVTLVELLEGFTEGISRFYATRRITRDMVPHHERVFPRWTLLLKALREGDVTACARYLDWPLKFMIIDREMARTGHAMEEPEIRILDQLYSHVDKNLGLYWGIEQSGFVERCLSDKQIAYMQSHGPDNTRAYTRTQILKKFWDDVVSVDWGEMRVRISDGPGTWLREKRILLNDPAQYTKAQVGEILEKSESIRDCCAALEGDGIQTPNIPSLGSKNDNSGDATMLVSVNAKQNVVPCQSEPGAQNIKCMETSNGSTTMEDAGNE